jgi:DNA repair exonuclease SbcCD nuclease subunit
MRKAIAIAVTDSHYHKSNLEEVNDCLFQSINRALELGVKYYFHCGDVFTSRYGRSFEELKAFNEYLSVLEDSGLESIVIISGNHDKKDQTSDESYLDIFKRNNSKIQIVSNFLIHRFGDFYFCFLPFFSESVYSDKINSIVSKIKKKGRYFLFTHVAVNGVRNNDGTVVSNDFGNKVFDAFEKVFIGHYHNRQEFDNIVYFGSLKQNDFGENKEKGWMVIYDDGSYEFEQSDFIQYINLKIDLSKSSASKLINLHLEKYGNNPNFNTRITLTGTESQLKDYDKKDFSEVGIDLKKITEGDKIITMDDLKIQNKNFNQYFKEWVSQTQEKDKAILTNIMEEYVAN